MPNQAHNVAITNLNKKAKCQMLKNFLKLIRKFAVWFLFEKEKLMQRKWPLKADAAGMFFAGNINQGT